MATLTPQQISKAGILDLNGALAAADVAGDAVRAAGGLLIVMENLDVAPHTLTIAAPAATANCGNLGDLAVAAIALVVAAGDTGLLHVPAGYVDSSNNFTWTYDAVTTVSIGVFSLSNG